MKGECRHPHHLEDGIERCAHTGDWMIEQWRPGTNGDRICGHGWVSPDGSGEIRATAVGAGAIRVFATWAEAEGWLLEQVGS